MIDKNEMLSRLEAAVQGKETSSLLTEIETLKELRELLDSLIELIEQPLGHKKEE